MKVLIRETLKTIGVNIYGTDGKLHTRIICFALPMTAER